MHCLVCNAPIETDTWSAILLHQFPTRCCVTCKEKFVDYTAPILTTDFIGTKYEGALGSITCLYEYNDWMRDVLHVYKFLGDVELAEIFRDRIKSTLPKNVNIVPIPMHPYKLQQRTFSPVEELLKRAGVPFENALEKVSSITMGKLKKEERLAASVLFQKMKNMVDKDIVLFDDLYTTGTTMHQAALVLKEAGAKSVSGIALIHA
ncbi:ComF family protein [Paenisporosarcina cavernae]|uniref:ComF family protein n=1 Tax=Paenisporosarcina cavernae TaxID=2320858 RepID=A0A385YSG2_9BACL|nr:phosphoribosyltransferase family protein [Paenisporosarcina cavernae]AYC28937.1 ComF family protein [Paenisporosarcina cavernae]